MKTLCVACFTLFFGLLASAAGTPTSAAVDTGLQTARALMARKDGTPAVSALDRHVRSNPQSAERLNRLGYSLRNQNKYDQALAAYPPRGAA